MKRRWSLVGLVLMTACGGRTGIHGPRPDGGEGGAGEPEECLVDAECVDEGNRCVVSACRDGSCVVVEEVSCESLDPCYASSCNPESGQCEVTPTTYDLDGDGFFGPLPGFEPGEPGACGNDCDDTSAAAHPGGEETCDGLDNDCNGVIDDEATYVPDGDMVRLSSADFTQATPSGLAFDGVHYAATYQGQSAHWRNYFHGLNADASTAIEPVQIASAGSDSFGGPIVWNGSVFATAWEDRRDNDYEIYFNQLDRNGSKLGPDLRLSEGNDFSLHPSLLWDSSRYVVVWDDLRSGQAQLFGRLVSVDGEPETEEIELTEPKLDAESPQLVAGDNVMGMVFKYGPASDQRIAFRTVSNDLQELGPIVELSQQRAVAPTVAASGGRFFVAWHTRSGGGPGDAIWGAAVSEEGRVLVSERPLTFDAAFARSKTWLPLGDRLLLIWAADYGLGYNLYSKMLTLELEPASPRVQVTSTLTDSASPVSVFGPSGDVGILFRDQRDGAWQTFFTRLTCVAGW